MFRNYVNDNKTDTCYVLDLPSRAECLCNLLNQLGDENERLRARNKYLERKIQRERNVHVKEHEKWEDEILTENEKIKKQRDFYYARLQKIIKIANGDFE